MTNFKTPISIGEYLRQAEKRLSESGIQTARLDALVLAEYATRKDRLWLLANPNEALTSKNVEKLNNLFNRRASHIPIAYLLNQSEFYGRIFYVNRSVLVPRPETEAMVDLFIELVKDFESKPDLAKSTNSLKIADLGTGCGAIGITLALETNNSHVDLIDIDTAALKVAKFNVDKFTLNIRTIQSDLLSKTKTNYDVILCNLPYVPDNFKINAAAKSEPKVAIFGGKDGLDLYRMLFKQISTLSFKPLYILIEAFPFQHPELKVIANQNDYILIKEDSFVQIYKGL